jgi:hypothetical protein
MLPGSDKKNPAIKGGSRDAKATGDGIVESGPRGVADQIADVALAGTGTQKEKEAKANKAYARAVVVHEMGHVLHKTRSPETFWKMKAEPGAFKNWMELALQVSEYATNNCLEFVAEVFTGKTLGLKYSAAIMAKYDEFGGP